MATGSDIDSLSRSELVEKARVLGVERPERMTRVELRDEMIRRTVAEGDQAEARGLFGVARSMLASVVESGLKFPDAAKVIRGDSSIQVPVANQTPVATVTLAEIYAAQGHQARALRMLEEVLREEPEHHEALRVRRELIGHDAPLSRAPDSAPMPLRSSLSGASTQESKLTTPTEPPATPEYVPGGFLDTTGEEIQTGKPPVVEAAVEVAAPFDASDAFVEAPVDASVDAPETWSPFDDDSTAGGDSMAEDDSAVDDISADVASGSESPRGDSQVALAPYLVIDQENSSLSLYWELPPSALEHCGVDLSDGGPAIRLVAFTPSGISPVRSERTLNIEAAPGELGTGTRFLPEFGKPAVVRAALGWQSSDGFLPLSVGRSLQEWNESDDFAGLLERAESELEKNSPRA